MNISKTALAHLSKKVAEHGFRLSVLLMAVGGDGENHVLENNREGKKRERGIKN